MQNSSRFIGSLCIQVVPIERFGSQGVGYGYMRFLGHNVSCHSVFSSFFLHDLCDLELIYCIRNAKLASSHFFYDRRDVCIHKFWPTFVGCFQSLIDWQLMCGFVRRSAAEKRAWLPLHSI